MRLYRDGADPSTVFAITRRLEPLTSTAVGPNSVLSQQNSHFPAQPMVPPPAPAAETKSDHSLVSTPSSLTYSTPRPAKSSIERLLGLVQGAYELLNTTLPEKAAECWLCLSSLPPYYEGVAINNTISISSTNDDGYSPMPTLCEDLPKVSITLQEVSGSGLCIGNFPQSQSYLCNHTLATYPKSGYVAPSPGAYWACSTGITTCISLRALKQNKDYCVLVELYPRIWVHSADYMTVALDYTYWLYRPQREPISLSLALLLGGLTAGGIAAGISTGSHTLVTIQNMRQLQMAMHEDLKTLEESISALEQSLSSLSEVVLQNRRGLDILFLKEGGLCAALKEECCFYADKTGVVRDNMAKLRERLAQRQKLFDEGKGWFEDWFSRSPWLTTLVSSLVGPLVVLLLVITIGSCLFNRAISFIKDRVTVVEAIALVE